MSDDFQSAGDPATATCGAAALSPPATGQLFSLPTADRPAVCQVRRGGRLPKAVISLRRQRMGRDVAMQVLALQAQITMLGEQRWACRREGVELKNTEIALFVLIDANQTRYRALDEQEDRMRATLALLVTPGGAQ